VFRPELCLLPHVEERRQVLRAENLRLNLNGRQVINGLSFQVKEGTIHGLLGVNGTGKTTLANLLMGICYPDEGSIVFQGQDITHRSISERAKMGISLAWQEPARFEGLSVREYLSLRRRPGTEELESYLWTVGLLPAEFLDRAVDATLSGGERKRVELASVMAMKPRLAILDEPDSGIDVLSLPHIMNGIAAMGKQGSSVLLITHSEEAIKAADEVWIACDGRIVNTGQPEELCEWFKSHCSTCSHVGEPEHNGA
jgi:Fe-S cluster assembly ATP-binding protein